MQCILETDINSDSNKVTMVVDGDQKNNVGRSASRFWEDLKKKEKKKTFCILDSRKPGNQKNSGQS